jgi:hypothetical protein
MDSLKAQLIHISNETVPHVFPPRKHVACKADTYMPALSTSAQVGCC